MYDPNDPLNAGLLGTSGVTLPPSGLLASSGPGLTPQSFLGALGADTVTGSPSAVAQSVTPGQAPAPSLGGLLGDGSAPVPQFAPPVNPAIPIHHGFLARIGAALTNGIAAPLPALANAPGLTPADLHRAQSNAWLALGSSLLNPRLDAAGFRQSTLGSIAAGIENARNASDQTTSGAINVHAAMLQQAQSQQMLARRAQLQSQFQILPADTPEQIEQKVQQLAAGYAQIGDTQSLNALGQASGLFKQPKPPAAPRALEHVETIDPKTGKPAIGMIDSATGEVVKYLPAVVKPDAGERALSVEQQDKSIDRVTKTYDNETKDFQKARSGYEVLQGALANPNLYAPFAMLDAFARVVNPGAIVRPTTLELLKATGSGEDRIRRWASLLEKGQWPADLTGALNSTIGGIMQQHYTTAQAARKRALTRLNTLRVPDADSYLDDLNYGASPSAPPSIAAPRPTTAAPKSSSQPARGNY